MSTAVLNQNLNRAFDLIELTPANEISLLGPWKTTLSKCCIDLLRLPRFSSGIGFAHAQMPELLRGRMGRSGPGNHLGMVDQRPAIPEPDTTGQKESQAERYNPDRQARSRTQNRRKDLRTPCEQLAENRLFFRSRLRRSRACAKNLHRIFLYLLKAQRNVEQASVERGRRERSYRRGHFHQRIRIGMGIRRKSISRRRGIIVLLLF